MIFVPFLPFVILSGAMLWFVAFYGKPEEDSQNTAGETESSSETERREPHVSDFWMKIQTFNKPVGVNMLKTITWLSRPLSPWVFGRVPKRQIDQT